MEERIKIIIKYEDKRAVIISAVVICMVGLISLISVKMYTNNQEALAEEATEKEGEISDEDSSENKKVYAEGTFDNIMGYSGYYVYFEGFLIEGDYYADDGTRVIVYSELEDGIRYAFVSDTTDEEYYNSLSWWEVICEYLKDTNEVKFSYWVEEEQDYNKVNTVPIEFEALTWLTPDW
jgi:hypothetical protein